MRVKYIILQNFNTAKQSKVLVRQLNVATPTRVGLPETIGISTTSGVTFPAGKGGPPGSTDNEFTTISSFHMKMLVAETKLRMPRILNRAKFEKAKSGNATHYQALNLREEARKHHKKTKSENAERSQEWSLKESAMNVPNVD
jgi:hypothetical protein